MRENAGKMRTKINPNTDTFYAVQVVVIFLKRSFNCKQIRRKTKKYFNKWSTKGLKKAAAL